jgi:hypothetical protein
MHAVYGGKLNLASHVQRNYAEHDTHAPRNNVVDNFVQDEALDEVKDYVHEQASQQQNVRVIRVDESVYTTRETERHC